MQGRNGASLWRVSPLTCPWFSRVLGLKRFKILHFSNRRTAFSIFRALLEHNPENSLQDGPSIRLIFFARGPTQSAPSKYCTNKRCPCPALGMPSSALGHQSSRGRIAPWPAKRSPPKRALPSQIVPANPRQLPARSFIACASSATTCFALPLTNLMLNSAPPVTKVDLSLRASLLTLSGNIPWLLT